MGINNHTLTFPPTGSCTEAFTKAWITSVIETEYSSVIVDHSSRYGICNFIQGNIQITCTDYYYTYI